MMVGKSRIVMPSSNWVLQIFRNDTYRAFSTTLSTAQAIPGPYSVKDLLKNQTQ